MPKEVCDGSDCWEDPENVLCSTVGLLLCTALLPAPGIGPRDHSSHPRDRSPTAGIAPPIPAIAPPIPGTRAPQGKQQGQHEERRSWEKPLQWGNGNMAKQLLPAPDSSVPLCFCQITRINISWSPSRGAVNSQLDV